MPKRKGKHAKEDVLIISNVRLHRFKREVPDVFINDFLGLGTLRYHKDIKISMELPGASQDITMDLVASAYKPLKDMLNTPDIDNMYEIVVRRVRA